jgi:glycosyltransferase involved in cell wall biosynthesis
MKILLIGQLPMEIGGNYTTGAANVVYELGKQSFGDVIYYTYGTNISHKNALKESSYPLQYIGYKIQPLKMLLYTMRHPILSLKKWKHYCRIDHQNFIRYTFYEYNIHKAIKLINPDLIHVNSIDNVSPVRFALNKKKIPVLLTCHGIFYRGDKKDIIHRDRALGNIHLVDAYSGLTKEALDEFEYILGIPKDRVCIIPNGVDCRKFYFSNNDRTKIRKEFGVNGECIVFLTVASVQKRKGQLAFLEILSQLELDDYQYWIIGNISHSEYAGVAYSMKLQKLM